MSGLVGLPVPLDPLLSPHSPSYSLVFLSTFPSSIASSSAPPDPDSDDLILISPPFRSAARPSTAGEVHDDDDDVEVCVSGVCDSPPSYSFSPSLRGGLGGTVLLRG
ncbi:hypothetical protein B0H10DRAFT_2231828 [Mycena sp. CBHHK59/15]|nr:hypothetical protein B0H10DRAFT_2231828 [Mycena sp. CBHHK59/15]